MEKAGNNTMTAANFIVNVSGVEAGPIHSNHLPPSMDDEKVLMDWDSELIIYCQKCASNILFSLLNKHNYWHVRVNLLFRFRALIKESPCLPFGPAQPGCLLKMDYKHTNILLKTQFAKSDVKGYLKGLSMDHFVNLKFAERLKYTFGTQYINRVTQGEFVYLSLNDEDSCGKAENYFSLKCSDEGFWIHVDEVEGRCPSTVVSVNGVVVGGGLPHQKITFGDIVTISNDGDGTKNSERRFCDLVFKASQSSEQVPRGRDATVPCVGAMDNNLIVQNIARKMPTEALRRLRFVSHAWNVECLTQMRDRVVLTVLSNKCQPNGGQSNHTDGTMQISTFMQSQLNDLRFPRWRIELFNKDIKRPRFQFSNTPNGASITPIAEPQGKGLIQMNTELDKKLLDDLIVLFDKETNTNNVKSLVLSGEVNSTTQLKMFTTILAGVGTHLTTLELSIQFCETSTPSWGLSMEAMSVLTSLTLTLDGPSPTPSFFAEFLSAVQNIQTLILNNPVKGTDSKFTVEGRNYLFPQNCLETISKLQTEGGSFLNLTSITVATCGDYCLQPLCLLPQGRLRKLEMGRLSPESDFRYYGVQFGGFLQLPLALSRHQHSIQELVLYFTTLDRMDIKFPTTMPNLRSLSLFFQLDFVFQRADVHFSFGTDVPSLWIDYRKRWPSLVNLTVWPVETSPLAPGVPAKKVDDLGWRKITPIIAPFVKTHLGEDGRVIPFSNLQTLDIPFRLKSKYHEVLDNLEVIFPNVRFPLELGAARQGRRYDDDESSSDEDGD